MTLKEFEKLTLLQKALIFGRPKEIKTRITEPKKNPYKKRNQTNVFVEFLYADRWYKLEWYPPHENEQLLDLDLLVQVTPREGKL